LSIELTDVLLKPITRIAPTPSGFLHVGNALNAVLIWLWARQHNASILLRIDDLDQERVRSEYVEDVFRTLEWLGIDWDVGPQSVIDFHTQWSQHRRIDAYYSAIQVLVDRDYVYHCRCSRTNWLTMGYKGCSCRLQVVEESSEAIVRLNILPEVLSFDDAWIGTQTWEFDPNSMVSVVRKRDGLPSYQIASTVDDVLFEVNHIVRGQDLVESSAFQLHLSELMGLSAFRNVRLMHHPLVKSNGGKLSKSAGAMSLNQMRNSGMSLEHFYRWVSSMMGSEPVATLADLLLSVNTNTIPFSQNPEW
jgi:glutamyl/glutaminyl-tRNA synthetase